MENQKINRQIITECLSGLDSDILDKVIKLLHLANKAGNVSFGYTAVKQNILKKKAELVIVAEDVAENTKNKLLNLNKTDIKKILIFKNKDFLSKEFNYKNLGLISINNINFTDGILNLIGK